MPLSSDQVAALESLACDVFQGSAVEAKMRSAMQEELAAILPLEASVFTDVEQVLAKTLLSKMQAAISVTLLEAKARNLERLGVVRRDFESAFELAQRYMEESFAMLEESAAEDGHDQDTMRSFCDELMKSAMDLGLEQLGCLVDSGSGFVQKMMQEWRQAVLAFGAKRIQALGLVDAGGMVTPPQMNEQTTSPRGQQCDAVEPTLLAGSNTQEGHRGVDAERYTHVAAGAGAGAGAPAADTAAGVATGAAAGAPTASSAVRRAAPKRAIDTQDDSSDGESVSRADQQSQNKRARRTRTNTASATKPKPNGKAKANPKAGASASGRQQSCAPAARKKAKLMSTQAATTTHSQASGQSSVATPATAVGLSRPSRLAQVKEHVQAAFASRIANRVQQLGKKKAAAAAGSSSKGRQQQQKQHPVRGGGNRRNKKVNK